MKPDAARTLVLAESERAALRIEAALAEAGPLRVVVGPPHALARLVADHDPAVVVVAGAASRIAAALSELGGALQAPALVLLVDDPRAAWTGGARRAGVRAVLRQDATAGEIAAAARAAAAGLLALDPAVLRAAPRASGLDADGERGLTGREREILEAMAEGLSNRAIARRLGISAHTVKFHVGAILDKLGAATRAEAVTRGIRRGLLAI